LGIISRDATQVSTSLSQWNKRCSKSYFKNSIIRKKEKVRQVTILRYTSRKTLFLNRFSYQKATVT